MIKDMLKLGIILFLISAIATGVLAWVNAVTITKIEELKKQAAIDTRQALLPAAKTFEERKSAEDTTFVYYIAKDEKGAVLGYTFVGAKQGYSSVVKTMAALDKDFNIINLKVFEQNETPGLGTLALEKDFPKRFIGKGLAVLKVDKDGGAIKSLTGATITTRAITNSLSEGILMMKEDMEDASPEAAQSSPGTPVLDKKTLKEQKRIKELMPAAVAFERVHAAADTSFIYQIAKDDKGNLIGYAFHASEKGYSSVIRTIVAVDKDFKVTNLRVIKQDETPGLGSLCTEADFPSRFIGKELAALKVDKDGGKVKCITGCTITTRAITKSLREAILIVKNDLAAKNKGGAK